MNFFLKLIILGIFLINYSGFLLANLNTPIFSNIECEIKFENDKSKLLFLDIADNFEKRSQGLMNRKKIEPNSGMLFIWEDSKIRNFWMKNTYFNLDLFFINDEGTIVEIYKNAKAFDETNIISKEKVKFVLEMNAGDIHAKIGDNLICALN
jgi:uncharacterized membrane protein (UPF0127 family)